MSNRSASRHSSTNFGSNAPSRKATTGESNREATRKNPNRQSAPLSVSTSFDHPESGYHRKASPNSSYCRRSSPSPSRSGLLNSSNSSITLTPSEKRCLSCSRFAAQLDEFNSRQSTPVRRPKSRSPSPAPVMINAVIATPNPPASPAVDHRQRLVMAPTPPPFSPHQDFPYERDDAVLKLEQHVTPTHSRSARFDSAPSVVDELTSTFSPTISLPSPSKPPVYPGFTPPKAPPLEPLLPARRREHFSPSSTMSTLDTTFSSPDKGVWVPSSPLRGTSFNRTGCPYLTRSLSPSHQDRQQGFRVDSPKKTPAKPVPVKAVPTPVNMYDHSVVLATPSSKPTRKGAPTASDTTSLSSTHSVPAKHGSSGIYSTQNYVLPRQNTVQYIPQESFVSSNSFTAGAGTPFRDNTMSIFTSQDTPTRQDANPTQVVFIPVQVPPQQPHPQQQQQQHIQSFLPPSSAPVTVQYTFSNNVPPSSQGYTAQQAPPLYAPLPPSQPPQYAPTPQILYPSNASIYAPPVPPAPVTVPATVPVQNVVQYVPAAYNAYNAPHSMQYSTAAPLIHHPAAHNTPYAYMAASTQPIPYMYAAPHPVDTYWVDQNRFQS